MNDSTWTWISGNDTTNQPGMYKEKGNARTDNAPGSRYGAVGLYDGSTQEFWVFGGIGCSSNCIYGMLFETTPQNHTSSKLIVRLP